MIPVMRWGGIALLAVLVSACASKSDTRPVPPPTPTPQLTNRELMDALVREGVGRIATGEPGKAPSAQSEGFTTEIRETPAGVVVTFRSILFEFNSALLSPQARREVDRFAFVLKDPRVQQRRVTLEGHADAIGTPAYNLELSRRRATMVADELIAHGVRSNRVAVEAYGERRPVAPNTNPDGTDNPGGRALNRRVEAVIRN